MVLGFTGAENRARRADVSLAGTSESQHAGHIECPSEANYLLLRAPVGLDTALLRRGIAIRSCENYPGLGPGWYRIAVRLHEENEALLETMRRVTEEAHGI